MRRRNAVHLAGPHQVREISREDGVESSYFQGMGDAPEAEPTLEADVPAEAEAEAQKPAEPEPPGDPKKEWALALGIMLAIATICWAFLTLLRAP